MTVLRPYRPGMGLAATLTFGVATLSAIASLVGDRGAGGPAWDAAQALFENYLASLVILSAIPAVALADHYLGLLPRRRLAHLLAAVAGCLVFAGAHIAWTLTAYAVSDWMFSTVRTIAPGPVLFELARESIVFALVVAAVLLPPRSDWPMAGASHHLLIKDSGVERKINPADISHIVASRNYVVVHHGGVETTARSTLKAIEDQLPEDAFIKVNRSTLVNIAAVCELRRVGARDYSVQLETGNRIRLSRGIDDRIRALLQ